MADLVSEIDKVEKEIESYKRESIRDNLNKSNRADAASTILFTTDEDLTKMAWKQFETKQYNYRHPWYLRHTRISGFLIGTPIGFILASLLLIIL